MVRTGMVVEFDPLKGTGIIQDLKGVSYFFNLNASNQECQHEHFAIAPYIRVTFVKDPDFKTTPVAIMIKRIEARAAA